MMRCSILLAVSLFCIGLHGQNRLSVKAGRTGETCILFTGDILLDRGVRRFIEKKGADALFSQSIDSVFKTCDVVVGNLECPATKIKSPVQKRYIFRGEPEWLSTLYRHGFTHLNLANNHAIDQGRQGLVDTWENVRRAGMVPLGAGKTMQAAAQPVLLARQPRAVWLVPSLRLTLENWAYLEDEPTVSQESMESLIFRIKQIKKADSIAVVIVTLHWGGEHTLQPIPAQRMEAHRLIRAGADVVVGHHTHTLQAIEDYQGHTIYYSIGNFIFDQPKPINSKACMVKLTVKRDALKTETIPVEIRNCRPNVSESSSYRLAR